MLLWVTPALACPPSLGSLDGFEPGLDGAVDLPTDTRIVLLGTTFPTVTLSIEGQEPVEVSLEQMPYSLDSESRIAIIPASPLLPLTEYRVNVFLYAYPSGSPPFVEMHATFTTGAGPVGPVNPPVIEDLSATAWTTEGWPWVCNLATFGNWREITASVRIDELPPRSYLMMRSQGPDRWSDLILPVTAGEQQLVFPQSSGGNEPPTNRDCIEPILLLPNGDEIAGEPWCLPPPEETDTGWDSTNSDSGADTGARAQALPKKQGFGCGFGSSASMGWLAGWMGLGALCKRRARA